VHILRFPLICDLPACPIGALKMKTFHDVILLTDLWNYGSGEHWLSFQIISAICMIYMHFVTYKCVRVFVERIRKNNNVKTKRLCIRRRLLWKHVSDLDVVSRLLSQQETDSSNSIPGLLSIFQKNLVVDFPTYCIMFSQQSSSYA
jgi:hypothetical protein